MNLPPPGSSPKREELLQTSKEGLIKIIADRDHEIILLHNLLKELYTQHQMVQKRLAEVEQQLQERQQSDGYGNASSWISKIVFILQHENRPLRSPDLIRLLEKREPALAEHHNKVQYFSAFLSNAVSYGRVIQQKVKGTRGHYYLLPQWLDEQGKVKPAYAINML